MIQRSLCTADVFTLERNCKKSNFVYVYERFIKVTSLGELTRAFLRVKSEQRPRIIIYKIFIRIPKAKY